MAKEEFDISNHLEKLKLRIIRTEYKRKRFSSTLSRFRSSLRASLMKSRNSVFPQNFFKESELKTTTPNSINDLSTKGKKKGLINPMITILFLGMTFKAWKSFTIKKLEGILLVNDSLPVNKNDSEDEREEDQEESEDNNDGFEEKEENENGSKTIKSRRVGFVNFSQDMVEVEKEIKNDNDSISEIEEEDKDENHKKKIEIEEKEEPIVNSKKSSIQQMAFCDRKSILKTRFSRVSLKNEEKRPSKMDNNVSLLFVPKNDFEKSSSRLNEIIESNVKGKNRGNEEELVSDSDYSGLDD